MKPTRPSHVKLANRRMVYDWIAQQPSFSRARVTRELNISGPTVQRIVQYFISRGIAVPAPRMARPRVGRQPELLKFDPGFAYCAGLYIDYEDTLIGLSNMEGALLYKQSLGSRGKDVLGLLQRLPELVRGAILEAGLEPAKLGGVGIGVPGVVSPDGRSIQFAPLIGITKPLHCAGALRDIQQALQVPVVMENEVNAAAWGAFVHLDREEEDLLYCSIGTGLGVGIILDGKLWRGRGSLAGELGYTSFSKDSQADPARPGWLEARISLSALREAMKGKREWTEDADKRRELAGEIAAPLSLALANFQHMMDINTLVLGGFTVRELGGPFLEALEEGLARHCLRAPAVSAVEVRHPGLIGLASLASEKMLENLLQEDEALDED